MLSYTTLSDDGPRNPLSRWVAGVNRNGPPEFHTQPDRKPDANYPFSKNRTAFYD